jgi:hypothetical protein
MASITVLSCIALIAGLGLSVVVGAKGMASIEPGCLGSAFSAVVLGIALSFAAGLAHGLCEMGLRFCAPTTDTNVWSLSYPLMAIPIYWIIMFFSSRADNNSLSANESTSAGTRNEP